MTEIVFTVSDGNLIPFTVQGGDDIAFSVSESVSANPTYTGSLTVTPSQSTQTLSTSGYVMPGNVVVNPIPSNYGLVVWNGSVLTVS